MIMTRRTFLATMLAACAAPAIVRASSLMKIVVPTPELLWPWVEQPSVAIVGAEAVIDLDAYRLSWWSKAVGAQAWQYNTRMITGLKIMSRMSRKLPPQSLEEWCREQINSSCIRDTLPHEYPPSNL